MKKIFKPEYEENIPGAIKNYLEEKNGLGLLSSSSTKNRRYELKRFEKYCKQNKIHKPADIHKKLLIFYIKSLNISNASKSNILHILTSFMNYLLDEGLILENIASMIEKPRVYPPMADYLTFSEIERLFQAVAQNSGRKNVDRNLLLLSLFTDVCLRVSEVIQLKFSDVRLDSKEMWIMRKRSKIDKMPLHDDLVQKFLRWYDIRPEYKGSDTAWVFLSSHGQPLKPRQVHHIVSKGLEQAGILKRKHGPHLLRHSGASLKARQGENLIMIQYLLGHENLNTTRRYLHFDWNELRDMVERSPAIGHSDAHEQSGR